jgi:hypothetical protein
MRAAAPLLLLATACNQLLGTPDVRRGACDLGARFVDVEPVAGLDDALGLQGAQLSGDELTVVFSRPTIVPSPAGVASRYGDLYVARRDHRGDAFQAAVALDGLNTDVDEHSAALSADQQMVYFDRRGSSQRYRIFAASRRSPADDFSSPVPLELGDAGTQIEPFVTADALYFASRAADGSAHLFEAAGRRTSFAAPRQLASLETLPPPTAYENPVVASNGLTIYFSAPPDNASPQDIWTAARIAVDQPFGAPHPVVELNTVSAERPTWISEDSCRLYFLTNRTGQGFRLWVASRAASP